MSISASRQGRSLELYFIDGRPDGMLTAEVFNWTGHVLMTPRTQIGDALRRREADHTGVYLLLGESEQGPLAYIGEGEIIADRIRNHDSKKDWWTKAVLVTTSANNLNKAHIKFLESRLIQEALEIGRIPLENGNIPSRPGLSEAAVANMEGFLDYLFLVLPAIGVDIFVRRTRTPTPISTASGSTTQSSLTGIPIVFETSLQKDGIRATATLINGEFVVQAGSLARQQWVGDPTHNYRLLFEELVKEGVLVENGLTRRFAQSYAFSSPSAAAAVVKGRSSNGPSTWTIVGTGQTYRDWESDNLLQ
ncbi:MAG: GIY-YIG nuclease family protein [Nibricoccus sp.]